jgi:hypothetical protein
MIRLALLFLIWWPATLWAQAHPGLRDGDAFIPEAEWRALSVGQTVFYFIDGQYFGREYYFPDGRAVRFQTASGICLEGFWRFDPSIRAYCFLWPGDRVCFHHVRRGEDILIFAAEPNEDGLWGTQSVEHVEGGGFECDAGFTS